MKHSSFSVQTWFMLRYLFWSCTLFILIYFENISPLYILNTLQTSLSIYLTQLWIEILHLPIQVSNEVFTYTHGFKLTIVKECNGLIAFLLLTAAILSYPISLRKQFKCILIAYFLILLGNTIRLDYIVYEIVDSTKNFTFAHEVIGRYGITFYTLLLFYIFVSFSSPCKPISLFSNNCDEIASRGTEKEESLSDEIIDSM